MNPPAPSVLFVLLALSGPGAFAHGGTYRGPADAIPPGAGGAPPAPSAVSPPGAQPPAPGAQPPSINAPRGPRVPPTAPEPDGGVWQLWWGYNNAAYVDVKRAIHSSDLLGGSPEFFLGHRSPAGASDRIVPTREAIEKRIVPALRGVLARERDADMVTGALVALAKIGEVDAGETSTASSIAAFLPDDNQEIAETAAISLGILAHQGSIATLTDLLFDRPAAHELLGKPEVPWRTRAFAAYGLGLIGNQAREESVREAIVATLSAALTSGDLLDVAIPDVAVACLSAIGIVPLSVEVGADGVRATGRMRQIDALLAFGRRKDLGFRVRAHLPTAVSRLLVGTPDAWGLQRRVCGGWIEQLSDGRGGADTHRVVQQSCVLALGRVGRPGEAPIDRAVREALLSTSRSSPNVEVRRFALIALAQIGSRATDDDAEQAVSAAIRAHLIARSREGSAGEQAWAALALGVLGRRTSEAAGDEEQRLDALLVDALTRARAPRDVGACAIACGMRRQRVADEALLAKLNETRDDEARGYVALALGMSGASGALEPIEEVVRRSKYRPELLRQAATSLGLLGDKDVVPELIGMLKQASSLSAQASIASALGAIGDARSIDPLIRMLEDEETTPRARAFAAVALGIVADKEPRPWNAKLAIGVNYRANTTTLTDGRGAGILEIL